LPSRARRAALSPNRAGGIGVRLEMRPQRGSPLILCRKRNSDPAACVLAFWLRFAK
jgi:hypothetical protein